MVSPLCLCEAARKKCQTSVLGPVLEIASLLTTRAKILFLFDSVERRNQEVEDRGVRDPHWALVGGLGLPSN